MLRVEDTASVKKLCVARGVGYSRAGAGGACLVSVSG